MSDPHPTPPLHYRPITNKITIQTTGIIRQAKRADLPRLEWFGMLTPFRESIEEALTRAENGEISYLVAEVNGYPVGQVLIDCNTRKDDGVGIVWALRVIPNMQNLGIGSQLMDAAEQTIRVRGLRVAELEVAQDNSGAKRLYDRLGYQVCRETVTSWWYKTPEGETVHVNEDAWAMCKTL